MNQIGSSWGTKQIIKAQAPKLIEATKLPGSANLAYFLACNYCKPSNEYWGLLDWILSIVDSVEQDTLSEEASHVFAPHINTDIALLFANKMKQGCV